LIENPVFYKISGKILDFRYKIQYFCHHPEKAWSKTLARICFRQNMRERGWTEGGCGYQYTYHILHKRNRFRFPCAHSIIWTFGIPVKFGAFNEFLWIPMNSYEFLWNLEHLIYVTFNPKSIRRIRLESLEGSQGLG
jgi:hypothetical protein